MKTSNIALTCLQCGSDQLIEAVAGEPESEIICTACGAVHNRALIVGAHMKKAERLALELARTALRQR